MPALHACSFHGHLLALALSPGVADAAAPGTEIGGMGQLQQRASLPPDVCQALEEEIRQLGAVDVRELHQRDWESLQSWSLLKVFEQRRLLKAVE